jgi:hypothetical protein
MRGRLLARLDTDRLREHIEGDGFLSAFKFAITAKAMHRFHAESPAGGLRRRS